MDSLVQLAIMWFGVFVASVLATKTKLTSVLFFLAFGSLMVNIGILPTDSAPFIRGFAELGIILIMFALGFEENTQNFLRSIKRSWGVAFFGAVAPFITAYTVADYALEAVLRSGRAGLVTPVLGCRLSRKSI